MGKPTDSGSIVNILSGAGLTNDQISSIAGSTQAPISPDEVTKADADAQTPTDGAADATQASTASDNTKDTQTPAKPTNTLDKPAQAEPTSTGAKNLDNTNTAGAPTKPGKQEPSSRPTTPKQPGTSTAKPAQGNVATLAKKIKQSGANTDSIKRDLTGGSTTSSGSTVNLPDLATRIAKAGVQKQVRQMLIAK